MDGASLVPAAVAGTVMGTLARLSMLRADYRQYPSYPQGYTIHLALGFIAALLGAIAVPALATGDFAAASFLALAATQFREVRSIERTTLLNMEKDELVPRGSAYIEGIARVFEARNYLAMMTGLLSSLAATLVLRGTGLGVPWAWGAGVAVGAGAIAVLRLAMKGPKVGTIATVTLAEVYFEGPLLTIEGVNVKNVGLAEARRRYLEDGMAVVIEPKSDAAKEIIGNVGQRQAIAHEVATRVGIERDVDQPEFAPLPRRDPQTGKVVLALLPAVKDGQALIQAVEDVPILEAVVRRPAPARNGRPGRGG